MAPRPDGRPEPILIELHGVIEKWRWPDTGEEFYQLGEYLMDFGGHGPDLRLTCIIDRQESLSMQLHKLRSVFEILRNEPIAGLKQRIGKDGRLEIGRFIGYQGKELAELAERLGLHIERRDEPEEGTPASGA